MMSQYQTLGGEGSVATFGTPARERDEDEAARFYEDDNDDDGSGGGGFPSQRATSAPSPSSLPSAAPDLSFEEADDDGGGGGDDGNGDAGGARRGGSGRCLDVTIDPASFSGAGSDFGPPPRNLGDDDEDGDDDEPSFLRRARSSPPSSDAGSGARGGVRRARRPWDELRDESSATDPESSLQGRLGLGRSFVTVNVTRNTDDDDDRGSRGGARGGSDAGSGGAGGGALRLGTDTVEPTPIRHHARPPGGGGDRRQTTPTPSSSWDRSDEATPLLSNRDVRAKAGDAHNSNHRDRDRGFGRANTNSNSLSEVASSWATGASMRFRDPLHRRRDFAAAPGASPSWSGGLVGGRADGAPVQETPRATQGGEDNDDSKGWRGATPLGLARQAVSAVKDAVRRRRRGGVVVGTAEADGRAAGCGGCGEAFFELLRREDLAEAAAAASKASLRPRFSRALSALLLVHFGAAGLFDLVLLVRSLLTSGAYDHPPVWLGPMGLAYNPLIGPASSTLTKFGATGPVPVLLRSQSWRLLASLTLSTSLTQLLLNLWTSNAVLAELERRIGSSSAAGVYLASALVGGAWSAALPVGVPAGGTAEVTGLAGAGIAGLLAACLAEMGLGAWGERRRLAAGGDNGAVGARGRLLPRPGIAHALLLLSFLPCVFPYASLSSALGGALMGLGCGLFLFAALARGPRAGVALGGGRGADDDDDGQQSEALFEPVGTPTRQLRYGGAGQPPPPPPPPPDTSPSMGRGMTPRMRRSILASPGAADEETAAFHYRDASSPLPDRTFRRDERVDEHDRGGGGGARRRGNLVPLLRLAGLLLALAGAALPPLLLAAGAVRPFASTDDAETALEELEGGCRYLRRLHPAGDVSASDAEEGWACSEACVPLGLVRRAAGRRTWRPISSTTSAAAAGSSSWGVVGTGRCADLGYRCGPKSAYGFYLHSSGGGGPEVEAGVYVPPGSDGTCPASDEEEAETEA